MHCFWTHSLSTTSNCRSVCVCVGACVCVCVCVCVGACVYYVHCVYVCALQIAKTYDIPPEMIKNVFKRTKKGWGTHTQLYCKGTEYHIGQSSV